MELIDWIVMGAVLLIIGAALWYIIRAKKHGQKCIGCPDSKACSGNCSACSGCHAPKQKRETK